MIRKYDDEFKHNAVKSPTCKNKTLVLSGAGGSPPPPLIFGSKILHKTFAKSAI
jgi:hypothetical protein